MQRSSRKGIILAGGSGTRLHPMTVSVVKQLLPVYDKPMVYYPLSTLMLAGIDDILIITTPRDQSAFQDLLGDGSRFGISISYAVQASPDGLAQAFLIGKDFVDSRPSCLILGDNIYYGRGLEQSLHRADEQAEGATIFAYRVSDPERYGVVGFDTDGHPDRIVEKPTSFVSNYAVTGLYFYDAQVIDIARALKPSERGELEITDVNAVYLQQKNLNCEMLGRGMAWLDAGTPESLLDSAMFVQAVEKRQGLKIACLEEVAARKGFITPQELIERAEPIAKSDYGKYLLAIGEELLSAR